MKEPYIVIIIFEARPQKELKLKEELLLLAEVSRREEDCLEYRVHRGISFLFTFILYKKWKNKESYQEHLKQPYIVSFVSGVHKLLAKGPDIISLSEI